MDLQTECLLVGGDAEPFNPTPPTPNPSTLNSKPWRRRVECCSPVQLESLQGPKSKTQNPKPMDKTTKDHLKTCKQPNKPASPETIIVTDRSISLIYFCFAISCYILFFSNLLYYRYHTMPYHSSYAILYHTISHNTKLHCYVLHCIALNYAGLHCIALRRTIPHRIVVMVWYGMVL